MTYNSTLPKVFVYLLTTIETLYQTRVPLEVQNRKNVHLATSGCLVIACYLWGVLHFSETLKAKHQLAQSLFPNFLEYSRFVRRCNALLPSIQVIRQALVFKEVEGMSVSIIDSFPIPLCQPIRNFRSKVLGDDANVGYNATKGQYFYGCKCHALVSESGYVLDYVITPSSIADCAYSTSAKWLFGLNFLHHAKAGGVVGFVGHTQMRREAFGLEPFLERTVQHDHRLAAGQRPHLTRAPGHGHVHAQPDGLAEGFLGGKARSQVAHAALGPPRAARTPGGQLAIGQHLFGKPLAVALQTGRDAAHIADVGANAVDHGFE